MLSFSSFWNSHLGPRLITAVSSVGMLVACSDTPSAPNTDSPVIPPELDAQLVICTAWVQDQSVSCAPQRTISTAVRANIIVGGQETYVQLTSSNPSYNPGTGIFSFDVTIKNLIAQGLGITEAGAVDPNGVRIFFVHPPTATSLISPTGSSATSIANADGTGTFTAAGQHYYQYDDELRHGVLVTDELSAPKTWNFTIDSNVATFTFVVSVSTAVQLPQGYVTGMPRLLTLDPGESFMVTTVVRNAIDDPIPGEMVTYQSTDPTIVSVAQNGTLTAGPSRGVTTASVSSGTRPGSMNTIVVVCPSIVVVNGTSLTAAIDNSDCSSSMRDGYYPANIDFRGDLYRVSLTAGQTITITMNTANTLDSYLVLADRSGKIVKENDDDPQATLGVGSRLVYTAPASGVYIIEATTMHENATGSYTLDVSIQ